MILFCLRVLRVLRVRRPRCLALRVLLARLGKMGLTGRMVWRRLLRWGRLRLVLRRLSRTRGRRRLLFLILFCRPARRVLPARLALLVRACRLLGTSLTISHSQQV